MRGREQGELVDLAVALLGDRVEEGDLLDDVVEEGDPHGFVAVGGLDLEGVALHAKESAVEYELVAAVLHLDEPTQQSALVETLANLERQHALAVLDRRTQAVDARHRRDDDRVTSGQQ